MDAEPRRDRGRELRTRERLLSGFEIMAAALGYRQTGDPFAGVEAARPALRIGLCSSLSWGFLRGLIRVVQTAPDPPALSVLESAPQDIVESARRGEIDVGFVYGAHDWGRLEYEELWREPLMVVLADGHPLASDSDVKPEALRGETFLVAGGPSERDLHMPLIERALGGAPAAVVAVPVERATLTDMVGLGFGVALTTGSSLGVFHPGVVCRPIAGPAQLIAFHAVWRPSNGGEALARFLGTARAMAALWPA